MRFRVALLLLLCSTSAFAEVVASKQVLDSVYSFSPGAVLDMHFSDFSEADPADNLALKGPGGSNLNVQACKATAVSGVYCLDGQVVRQWPDPLKPTISNPVFDCKSDFNPKLGKSESCVAMTVDIKGQIWLSVKKANGHSVYKVVRSASNAICATSPCSISEPFKGRPPVVDLIPVDGDIAKVWGQSGVIGIEERKHAVLFPDSGAAAVTVVSATSWNLKGKELLQGVALLQLKGTDFSGPQISVLAVTTLGRVFTRGVLETTVSARKLDIVPGVTACGGNAEAVYGIRASSTTGIIYISDSKCARVIATDADGTDVDSFRQLNYINELLAKEDSTSFSVIGLTIAPGDTISLADCSPAHPEGCPMNGLTGPNGDPAARLLGVQLTATSATGATVFQIKGIPDCRMGTRLGNVERSICAKVDGDVIIDPNGNKVAIDGLTGSLTPAAYNDYPAKLKLNVTPLLPDEVVLAFNASGLRPDGKLPPLLISRQYQAPERTGYVFEAFFVLPQPDVQFQNTFSTEYQVGILEGADAEHYSCLGPHENLLEWDITTHVSELYASVGEEYIDTLSNVGCGSVRGAGANLSLLPYDLQLSPDTWDPLTGKYTVNNDAVFARLLQSLYADLWAVQDVYACTDLGTSPLTPALCGSLTQRWNNGLPKLNDCVNAVFTPKSSASNQLCQGWVSQLSNYRDALPTTTPSGDKANRVGELKARIETIFHLYYGRFKPSIPAWGFCMESADKCTLAGQDPPPWAPQP